MSYVIRYGHTDYTTVRELCIFDTQDPYYGDSYMSGIRAGFQVDGGDNPIFENDAQRETWNHYHFGNGGRRYVEEIVEREVGVYTPPVVKCDCGREVSLDSHWENVCACDRAYNASGQPIMVKDPRCHCGAYYDGRDCMCLEDVS